MKAQILEAVRAPLRLRGDTPSPTPAADQVLIEVAACAVCRTDLHVVDGELPRPKLPLIPGHEIVGRVVQVGNSVSRLAVGARVGVPWLGWTCGKCEYCRSARENLCRRAKFTGYDLDGGYAELAVADSRYCFPVPDIWDDEHAAPLLCAGLIGFRALSMAPGHRIGLYGFGAAAHIVAQLARHQAREVFAFTRPGDGEAQSFARRLGAAWAGDSTSVPPVPLDSAILFAPVGGLVPLALRAVAPGGTVVCGGIHMSDIPSFPYELLWEERRLCSVANLTRADGEAFFAVAARIPVITATTPFRLEDANEALRRLRDGKLEGAGVLLLH